MAFFLYNALLLLAAFLLIPCYGLKILLTGKYRHSIKAKFGINRHEIYEAMQGVPRIWIHAVSVGEVTAAAPITAALRADFPQACLILSTGTETGQEMARRLIPEATSIIYFPLDIPFVIRKMIRDARPDIFVLTETELWPNFLRLCRKAGIPVVMVNGRLSPRSFRKYYLTRFFWKQVLKYIDRMGVISAIDAERSQAMGMNAEKISILGNAKYDGLAAKISSKIREETAGLLNLAVDDRVLVAGSTHEGEEAIILDVYRRLLEVYPDFKLILVPRHVERTGKVMELIRQSGFEDIITMKELQLGRRRQTERILVVDVIGELFKVYSLATIVYCGGSLVPKGGQNILEPAAWGKVVFYGPSMEDFLDEKRLLEGVGAGFGVQDAQDLTDKMLRLLSEPDVMAQKGLAAGQAVSANRGASARYASLIEDLLIRDH